jgi:hypothetical protein
MYCVLAKPLRVNAPALAGAVAWLQGQEDLRQGQQGREAPHCCSQRCSAAAETHWRAHARGTQRAAGEQAVLPGKLEYP